MDPIDKLRSLISHSKDGEFSYLIEKWIRENVQNVQSTFFVDSMLSKDQLDHLSQQDELKHLHRNQILQLAAEIVDHYSSLKEGPESVYGLGIVGKKYCRSIYVIGEKRSSNE